MAYEYLNKEAIYTFIADALKEDIGTGDHSTLSVIPENALGKAQLLVKDEGIIAGVQLAQLIFHYIDPFLQFQPLITDGQNIKKGEVAFVVKGKIRTILTAERLVLNCMQRMSAIATETAKAVELCKGTATQILDTRKTTPNFRICEKWAVKIGGGTNHRFGLFDRIMLKDNHIDYAGGIAQALHQVQGYNENFRLPIEIETRSIEEVRQVLFYILSFPYNIKNLDVIMLDNMSVQEMSKCIAMIRSDSNCNHLKTEASGGITMNDIPAVAACGVDFISMGALTHSVKSLDLSLKAF